MKQISNYDAAIIGAGASGLAAALTIKKYKPGASVLVLVKKLGRVLLKELHEFIEFRLTLQ